MSTNLSMMNQYARSNPIGWRHVGGGGYAAVAHGASLMTRDVDICYRFSQENLFRLRDTLAGTHPRHRMTPFTATFTGGQLVRNDWALREDEPA